MKVAARGPETPESEPRMNGRGVGKEEVGNAQKKVSPDKRVFDQRKNLTRMFPEYAEHAVGNQWN